MSPEGRGQSSWSIASYGIASELVTGPWDDPLCDIMDPVLGVTPVVPGTCRGLRPPSGLWTVALQGADEAQNGRTIVKTLARLSSCPRWGVLATAAGIL